jgi:hypothetical protein
VDKRDSGDGRGETRRERPAPLAALAPGRRLRPGAERGGFAALLVASVVPVWSVRAFLTQDGPSHVYNAFMLAHAAEEPFTSVFALDSHIGTNWSGQVIVGALASRFAAPVAEKVFASACLVLMPIGFRCLLARVAPRAPRELSWTAFPLAAHHMLYLGFWNFTLGFALYSFALAAFWRFRGRPGLRRGAWFAVLLLALHLTHPVPLAHLLATAAVLFVYGAGRALRRRPQARARVAAAVARRGARIAAWALPAALLLLESSHRRQGVTLWRSWPDRVHDLASMIVLVIHHRAEQWLALLVPLGVAMAVCAAWWRRRPRSSGAQDAWLAGAVAALVIFFVAPAATSGGGYVHERMLLFPWPLAVLWLGAEATRGRASGRLGVALAAVAVALLAVRWPAQQRIDALLAEYRSAAAHIPRGAPTLTAAASLEGRVSFSVNPFLHALGYDAVERRLIELNNLMAQTEFFPLVPRPSMVATFRHYRAVEAPIPCVDLGGEGLVTPEAVLLFGSPRQAGICPAMQRELDAKYALAFTSSEGRARLFLRTTSRP